MSRVRPPGLLSTLLLLALVDITLRVFGYARVMRLARRTSRIRAENHDRALIESVFHQILKATALYPGRSQCLEQSVAGYVLLRRRGFAVQLRLGVQPYPFTAHAWLELDGAPITETPEVVSRFAVMPEIAV